MQLSIGDISLIFKFLRNPDEPQSLSNRIVSCYHDLSVDYSEMFSDRALMREAMRSLISKVWDQCAKQPCSSRPEAVIEIYEDERQRTQWRLCLEGIYEEYRSSLLPLKDLLHGQSQEPKECETLHFSDLIIVDYLGGRGMSAIARKSSKDNSKYVFKGRLLRRFPRQQSYIPSSKRLMLQ